jgi:hypothetical protein
MTNIQKGRPNNGNNFQRMTIDLEEETVSFNPVDTNEQDLQAINRLLNIGFLSINRAIMEMEEEENMVTPGEMMTDRKFTDAANEWALRQTNGEAREIHVKDKMRGYLANMPKRSTI